MPTLNITYRSTANMVRELSFQHPVIRLGRDVTSDVLFDEATDRMVSRNHAEIRLTDGVWFVHPMPGKIIYRQQKLLDGPVPLASGDLVEFATIGGPSVTVRYEVAAPPPPLPVTDSSPTVMEAQPVFDRPPAAPLPAPAAPPPLVDPPSFDLDLSMETAGAPSASEGGGGQQGTAFMPALDAAALLAKDAEAAPQPVHEKSRTTFRRTVVMAIFVLVSFASLAGAWVMHSREVRRRLAVQRVEALLRASATNGVAPEVSEEDLALFQEEVKANRHAPPTIQLRVIRREHGDSVVTAEPVQAPPPPKPKAPPVDDRGNVRKAFAEYMRAQILRLTAGTPHGADAAAEMKKLVADVLKDEAAYELAAKVLPPEKADATTDLIRKTLRQLGECDALATPRFLADAKAAVEKIKSDAGLKERLGSAMKRAADYRYGPTITAALADQGLPVELFFIPYEASGFDERRVELPTSNGIPKGMWGLLPDAAEAMGLHPGKLMAGLDADPGDERQHYEREVKKIAAAMRPIFLQKAGGSTLLFMATWDHGDTALLAATKKRAGIKADDTDPQNVNFWKVYDAGITDEMLHVALEYVATVTIAEQPEQFGFSFARPLEHVSLAEKE